MDQVQSTITERKKGSYLTYDERMIIQLRIKGGWSPVRIVREIGCAPNTIRNEIKRGTVSLYHDHVHRCKARAGQDAYGENRLHCCRHYDHLVKSRFISYVKKHFAEDNWSLDACVGRTLLGGEFSRKEVVCTKALYNYVEPGMPGIKNMDLPEKLKRNTKLRRNHYAALNASIVTTLNVLILRLAISPRMK